MDFLLLTHFWTCLVFYSPDFNIISLFVDTFTRNDTVLKVASVIFHEDEELNTIKIEFTDIQTPSNKISEVPHEKFDVKFYKEAQRYIEYEL